MIFPNNVEKFQLKIFYFLIIHYSTLKIQENLICFLIYFINLFFSLINILEKKIITVDDTFAIIIILFLHVFTFATNSCPISKIEFEKSFSISKYGHIKIDVHSCSGPSLKTLKFVYVVKRFYLSITYRDIILQKNKVYA